MAIKSKLRMGQIKQAIDADVTFTGDGTRQFLKLSKSGNVELGDGTAGVVLAGALSGASISTATNMGAGSPSDTIVASQAAIKAYIDAQDTAQDLDLQGDSGTIAIDLDLTVLDIAGGTGLTTAAAGSTLTVALDNTSVTAADYGVAANDDKRATFSVDAQGRLTAAGDRPIDIAHTQVNDFDAGVQTNRLDQMTAPTAAVAMNSQKITGMAEPAADSDAATKGYVDSVAEGLDVKKSVVAASVANIAGTYATVAGTITAASNGAFPSQDGITLLSGQRLLVKNQTQENANGIYELTTVGSGSAVYVLTRADDFDAAALTEISTGAFTFVEKGSSFANQGFVMSNAAFTGLNNASPAGKIQWSQFSGAGQITAGDGLSKTGNEMAANVDGVGIEISGDNLRLKDNGVTLAKMAGIARGSIIIGDASSNPSALANGSAHTFLQSDGSDSAYVAMSGDATLNAGALTIADNAVSLAKMAGLVKGKIIMGDGSNNPSALSPGTADQVLRIDAGGLPSYSNVQALLRPKIKSFNSNAISISGTNSATLINQVGGSADLATVPYDNIINQDGFSAVYLNGMRLIGSGTDATAPGTDFDYRFVSNGQSPPKVRIEFASALLAAGDVFQVVILSA